MPKGKFQDLTGQRFGRLLVIERAPNIIRPCGCTVVRWRCLCDCGKIIETDGTQLRRKGGSKSCGCLQKEIASKTSRNRIPTNTYNLTGSFGIGYIHNKNNTQFYFDLEDFDKIKNYSWYSFYGYICARERGSQKPIRLHRLIMNAPPDKVIDHINRNPSDNRKENLRICTQGDNTLNKKRKTNNPWGPGVRLMKSGHWEARLTYQGNIYVKTFATFEEAYGYRKKLEQKYFGEFAPKEEYK